MALCSLFCADVPLRNCSLAHYLLTDANNASDSIFDFLELYKLIYLLYLHKTCESCVLVWLVHVGSIVDQAFVYYFDIKTSFLSI